MFNISFFMIIAQIHLLTLKANKNNNEYNGDKRTKTVFKIKTLRDLIVVDVCISCDDDPFLDSRL